MTCLLTLCTRSDDPAAPFILPRLNPTEVGDSAAFEQARKWLKDCIDEHQACRTGEKEATLPDRVVDVSNGKVCLYHKSDVKEFQNYAALSYCWGKKKQSYQTTK